LHAPAYIRGNEGTFRQFACVERELDATIPLGARVYVDIDRNTDPLWFQRLSEMSTPRALVLSRAEDADIVIGVARVPRAQGCSGVELRVVRP
jgi:hypothetical protein